LAQHRVTAAENVDSVVLLPTQVPERSAVAILGRRVDILVGETIFPLAALWPGLADRYTHVDIAVLIHGRPLLATRNLHIGEQYEFEFEDKRYIITVLAIGHAAVTISVDLKIS
jgi:hypothetical protein